MATLVTGIFKTRSGAERAVNDLISNGFSRDDISLLMSDMTRGREFGVEMATKAPEGAAAGATVGGVLGAIAAGLVVLGTIVVPGLGLLAAGPVVAILAGLGAGAAAGGLDWFANCITTLRVFMLFPIPGEVHDELQL